MAGVDVVVTDTWISMGQDHAEAKLAAMMPFQVTPAVMGAAAPDALFLHCLPAHRGEEVVEAVIDGPQSAIWDEAENSLHAQKAVLLWCFGPTYLEHNGVLVISVLAAGALLRTPFEVWTALLRAQRRTGTLLAWTAVNSTVLLGLVGVLGAMHGAVGAACGVSIAGLLSAAVGGRGLRHDTAAARRSVTR